MLCALQLQLMLPSIQNHDASGGLRCAAGITSGTVYCGEAGSDRRREYTLSGARVNLAARLMQYAAKQADGGGAPTGGVMVAVEVRQAVLASASRS